MSAEAVFVGERRVRLDPRALLGEGGEGRVYRVSDLAVKIFASPTDARRQKLASFPARLPPEVVAPVALCRDASGAVVGYAMKAVDDAVPIAAFARRAFHAASPGRSRAVLAVFARLVRVVRELHARGVVVGDLNDGNVLVATPAAAPWQPFLIDADSMQLPGHPCVVAHERFLDPRLYGVDLGKAAALSRASDAYALAVLLFASLACVHPFGGTHPSHPTLLRRAEARVSVLSLGVKLPAAALPPAVFPDDALAFFHDVFERDTRNEDELLPPRLFETPFTRCSCGIEHGRRACPACSTSALVRPTTRARGAVRASSVLRPPRGHVVAAALHGGALLTLAHDGAGFVREDGARVPWDDDAPPVRVRLLAQTTWLFGRTHALRVAPGLAPHRIALASCTPLSEPAADATPAGLVHVFGDALVRDADGTRLGQVLEGQTWVRTGARLGFAFYRAGGVTVAFLFDVAKGPLRQLDMPPLEGRVSAVHAAFDDAPEAPHVLFRAVTETDGRVRHVAHLFDARGNRLASASGAEDASPIFGGDLESACVAGGSVLAATSDGLVLLRPDPASATFETRRVFADAKDFVSPDAALLASPGGSVYLRTHDEIVHLGFTEARETRGQP